MKKIMTVIAAVLSIISCSKDFNSASSIPADGRTSIVATTDNGMTKTSLSGNDNEGFDVLWSGDDSFMIGGNAFTIADGVGTTCGKFEGATPDDGTYTVYYPSSYDGTSWPSTQTYIADAGISFSPMKASVTFTDGKAVAPMTFKNEGGILRISVNSDESAKSAITIKSVSVNAKELSEPVTLDCGRGVSAYSDQAAVFHIALPAGTYTGVEIVLVDTNGKICTKTLSSSRSLIIKRSEITRADFTAKDFYEDYLCLTANTAGSSVSLIAVSAPEKVYLEYSTDRETWSDYTIDSSIDFTNAGDKVFLRNKATATSFSSGKDSDGSHYQFVMTGSISASGNLMSLVDKACQTTAIPCDFCFSWLFYNCTRLTSAPKLPATTLSQGCYYNLFHGCSNLTKAPELPASVMATECYAGMFNGCSNLTAAPDLMATELADWCYGFMFYKCEKLSYIKVAFTVWDDFGSYDYENMTTEWVGGGEDGSCGVASTGTFVCPEALDTEDDYIDDPYYIPGNWKIIKY